MPVLARLFVNSYGETIRNFRSFEELIVFSTNYLSIDNHFSIIDCKQKCFQNNIN